MIANQCSVLSLEEFRGRIPSPPATQVRIVQTADDAFQLELPSSDGDVLGDATHSTRPRVFATVDACARFAVREFGAHRVYFDLMPEQ